jgi:nucleotide-binding universal stress UspA family protein
MSGIVVGIDGSHNASHALEWAMTEATIRKDPLTVIAVHSVPASYWTGAPVELPGDQGMIAEIRKTAEAVVAKAAEKLGADQPESVTVTAVSGFPAKVLVDASGSADLLVVGARGGGGFGQLVLGSVSNQVVHHAQCPVVIVPSGK